MPVRLAHTHSLSSDRDATPFFSTLYAFLESTIVRYFLFGYLFLYYVIFVGNMPVKIKILDSDRYLFKVQSKILGGHGDGAHPLPFRTGKLRPFAPMVLLYQVGE